MRFRIPFLHNIRRGLATNSSSSHSLVYYTGPAEQHTRTSNEDGHDGHYGQNDFILVTLRDKLLYALTNFASSRYSWNTNLSTGQRLAELKENYGHLFPELTTFDYLEAVQGGVDHQSLIKTDNEKFVEAVRNPNVAIFGGDDAYGHPDMPSTASSNVENIDNFGGY